MLWAKQEVQRVGLGGGWRSAQAWEFLFYPWLKKHHRRLETSLSGCWSGAAEQEPRARAAFFLSQDIHPSFFYTHFLLLSGFAGVCWSLNQLSGRRQGCTLDVSLVHRRATQKEKQPSKLPNSPHMCVFALWEETGETTGYMQTPRHWLQLRSLSATSVKSLKTFPWPSTLIRWVGYWFFFSCFRCVGE